MATSQQAKAYDRRKMEIGGRLVSQLRSGVKRLFNDLLLAPSSASGDSPEERVQSAHKAIAAIQRHMLEIEKLSSTLDTDKAHDTRLGNLGNLSLDPTQSGVDLHKRATKAFQDSKRSYDVVNLVVSAVVRNDCRSMSSLEPYDIEPPAKLCCQLYSAEEIQKTCEQWTSSHPKLQLSFYSLSSGLYLIRGDVPGILTAYLQVNNNMLPVNVAVDEWCQLPRSSLPNEEKIFKDSQFKVFQEVAVCSKLTLLSLTATHRCDGLLVFNDFMEWLQSFSTLFNETCAVCKRHLTKGGSSEGPLPPCWRDLKGGSKWVACHRSCRSP